MFSYFITAIVDHHDTEFPNQKTVGQFFVNAAKHWDWLFVHEMKHQLVSRRFRMLKAFSLLIKTEIYEQDIFSYMRFPPYKYIWEEFLNRFNDVSSAIRTLCIETAAYIIINKKCYDMVEVAKTQLSRKLRDFDWTVRYESADNISKIGSYENSIKIDKILSIDLMKCLAMRIYDRNSKVRKAVLQRLATIFRCANMKFGSKTTFHFKITDFFIKEYTAVNRKPEERYLNRFILFSLFIFSCFLF